MALKRCGCKILDHIIYTRLIGGKYVFNFVMIFILMLSSLTMCVSAADMNCASVRYSYEEKGVSVGQVPKDPLSGDHLTVCPQGPTCCTQEMETKLQAQSLREFDRAVRDSLVKVVEIMRVRATRFDEYFKRLLMTSKRDLHDMFRKTYGIIYEQNSEVFTDLFEELEKYYERGQVDLSVALNHFFSVLYQKMFTVLNAQYRFTDMYLKCVSTHMEELKPFGDVPRKLSGQLKRSFVATRTYAQALAVAGDVANNMLKISPSQDCIRALTKMTGCPACQGLPELKACNNYCINVMKGCLAHHSELDGEWNAFVDSMDKVAERLLGPFNIEMVVDPINVKISEAIMNFQENGQDISQRVFSGCGKPPLGRRRRGADDDIEYKTLKFGRMDDGLNDMDFNTGTGRLGRVVKDIRQKVKETKKFWSHLPYQICNNDEVAASPTKEDSCWNGAMKARYEPQIIGDGITNQQSNPEVSVDVNHPSSILNEQMSTLQTITSKLKYAFNGEDVTWKVIETEEIASGGGSGSGDGDDTDDSDDDDDGDDSGSGDGYSYGGGRNTIGSGIPSNPYGPGDRNDIHLGGSGSGMDRHRPKNATSGFDGGMKRPELSVTRAVTSYLLPIVVMWFGGIFTEWL